jgi:hypothetical protein
MQWHVHIGLNKPPTSNKVKLYLVYGIETLFDITSYCKEEVRIYYFVEMVLCMTYVWYVFESRSSIWARISCCFSWHTMYIRSENESILEEVIFWHYQLEVPLIHLNHLYKYNSQ